MTKRRPKAALVHTLFERYNIYDEFLRNEIAQT